MVRYFYAWTPLVIVGTVVLLSLPWLGLIALMIFALARSRAGGARVGKVFAPYSLGRAIGRRWHMHVARRPGGGPVAGRTARHVGDVRQAAKPSETRQGMDATTLATEATRYLEAVERPLAGVESSGEPRATKLARPVAPQA